MFSLAARPQMLCVLGEEGCDGGRTENGRKQTGPWSVIKKAVDYRKSGRERLEELCKCFLWSQPLMCSHLKDITPSRSHPEKVDRSEGSGKRVAVTAYTCLWSAVKTKRPPSIIFVLRPCREKRVSKVKFPSLGNKSSQTATAKSMEKKFLQGTSSGHS